MFDRFFVQPIFNILLFLYNLVGDFGLSIILFVVILKLIMHPLIKSQYGQARRMRKIQPEISKINKKYADNPQRKYLMTMALYKKNDIKTSHSLVSSLIQLPIIIAMYRVVQMLVQSTEPISRFGYEFIKNLDNIKEIINDGSKFQPSLLGVVDLSQTPFSFNTLNSFILLGFLILMSLSQYYMTKRMQQSPVDENGKKRRMRDIFSEAADGKEPDQSEMNTIMSGSMTKFMPIMLFFTFGMVYGAVSFYYMVSNLVTLTQYRILDRNEMPEAKSVEESDIDERLRKSETAQIINERKQKTTKRKSKNETVEIIDKSGQRITRIKAKK